MTRRAYGGLLAAGLLAGALAAASPAPAEVVAFVGATLHPVGAPDVPDGVLLVEDGRITALGPGLAPPAGARLVDLAGKHLYPGFIHPRTPLGLIEISSVRGTVDTTEIGDVNASLRAEVAFNGESLLFLPAIAGGVLTAHVVPRGGIFNGSSALMRLDGWNWEDMRLQAPVGMHLTWPRLFRRFAPGAAPKDEEEFKKERDESLKTLRDTWADARAYQKARQAAAAKRGPAIDVHPQHEALLPVLEGRLPLFVHAFAKGQIESALDWAQEEKVARLVLVAGPDAQYLAARLAAEKVPVILDGVLATPARRWEPYDAVFVAAARLHAAGVRFAIGDGGEAANARNLPFNAAMAAAFGLPRETALRSVTLSVAEILGVADRLGSLAPGKEATFFASDGDPLEIRTRIERVWIAGREIDLGRDRQRQLWEKYRQRPRPQP